MIALKDALKKRSHFRQRVRERFGLELEVEDLHWITSQIQCDKYPTLLHVLDDAEVHVVQLKHKYPSMHVVGLVFIGERDGKYRLLTAVRSAVCNGTSVCDREARYAYRDHLKRTKKWKRKRKK